MNLKENIVIVAMHVDKQLTNYSHCFIMGCVSEICYLAHLQ